MRFRSVAIEHRDKTRDALYMLEHSCMMLIHPEFKAAKELHEKIIDEGQIEQLLLTEEDTDILDKPLVVTEVSEHFQRMPFTTLFELNHKTIVSEDELLHRLKFYVINIQPYDIREIV